MKPFSQTLLVAALFCGVAFAQPTSRTDNLFRRLDRSGDGKLTREDLPRYFEQLDTNKDGVITADEIANVDFSKLRAAQREGRGTETSRGTSGRTGQAPETSDAAADDLLSLLSKPAIDVLLVVGDLDRSLKFYRDGIGMRSVGKPEKLSGGVSLQRLQHGQTVFFLLAAADPPKQGPRIAEAENDAKAQIIAANGLRLIYLLVDDKEGILERLKTLGVEAEGGASAAGSYALFADPDGNPVAIQSTVPRRGGARRPEGLQMAHTVSNDEAARQFFGQTLGLPAAGQIPLRSMGATEYRHAVGESVVKFWAPTVNQRESIGGPLLERLGARAIVFPVRDLAAVRQILLDRGLTLLDETIPDLGEKPPLIIADVDGNRILFLEQPATAPAPSTSARGATPPATRRPADRSWEAFFDRVDRNKDGVVTNDELRNTQFFGRLDRNMDGEITREEAARLLNRRSTGTSEQPPASGVKPRQPTKAGPLLFDGTPGDAAGETQLFEQVFIKGITDVAAASQGMAWIDLNRDGRLDLLILQRQPKLFLNQGSFEFQEHPLHLDGEVTGTQAPTFVDFNGDGLLDFYLSTAGGRNRASLFLAQGTWDRFKEFAVGMGVDNAGAYARGQVSVGDVNGDGWLDMAIAANQIGSGGPRSGRPLSRLYVFRPAKDGVFEHGRFEDVGGTDVIQRFGGVDREKPNRDLDINGMCAVLRDLDDDGDLDLLRAAHNDMLRGDPLSPFATGDRPYGMFAWRNDFKETGRLKFTELLPAPKSLAEHGRSHWDAEAGHYVTESAAVAAETILPADIDNDGDLDVLVTGITGPSVIVHSLWTAARMWRNDGDLEFTDITESSGLGPLNWFADQWGDFWDTSIADGRIANAKRGDPPLPRGQQRFALKDHQLYFGNSAWGDFNNDGWLDLFQVSRFNGRDIAGSWRSNLFMNRGDGTFDLVKTELSGLNELGLSAQAVDVDGDGRLEAVLMRRREKAPESPVMVFWNTGRQFNAADNHWLKVQLKGVPQRQLIGARLYAHDPATGKLLGRRDYFVDHMRSSCEGIAHFGLGSHTSANVRVRLPDGSEVTASDVQANQLAVIDVRSGTVTKASAAASTSPAPVQLTASSSTTLPPGKASRAPNIVLLFADDLGYGDVGFQGADIPTPAIDRLADESVQFTQGYVSAPVCSPSRAGLMTGRYQNRFGHETNPASVRDAGTPASEITIAESLRKQGYRTALVGKWHLGVLEQFHPLNQGFDEFFGFLHGAHPYFPERARGQTLLRDREPVVEREYLTDAFGREAVSFIERNHDQPFFLYLSFNAVHTPIQATEKYLERFPQLTGEARTYAAMISAMDDAVGLVLATIRKHRLDENTLVFFLNDNGGVLRYASNAPLRGGKAMYFEGGIRVPFLLRWTGHLEPDEYRHPVIALDVFPTALAATGGKLPTDRSYDGVNLLPFLMGNNSGIPHETLFWRMRDMQAEVVRHGSWKYMNVRGQVSLFDIQADPSETKDVAPSRPEIVDDLAARFAAWNDEMTEPLWSFPAEERAERRAKRRNRNTTDREDR